MSLVFSVELFLNQVSFKKVGLVQPSIAAQIGKSNSVVLWTNEDKVHDGESIKINRAFQVMFTTDVFDAINSWKFGLNLTMPKDQVALGACTFEFKPLIASALANCGASPYISIQGSFKNFRKEIIAVISFDVRLVYYPGSEHTTEVEIFLTKQLDREPPHDNYFRPQLQSSSSRYSVSSDISVDTFSTSEQESDLLGTHSSYRNASDANRARLEAANKNLTSQIAAIRKKKKENRHSSNSGFNSTNESKKSYSDVQRFQVEQSTQNSGLDKTSSHFKSTNKSSVYADDFAYSD